MTLSVLWRYLTLPWVVLHCAIMVRSDHTHLLFLNWILVFVFEIGLSLAIGVHLY